MTSPVIVRGVSRLSVDNISESSNFAILNPAMAAIQQAAKPCRSVFEEQVEFPRGVMLLSGKPLFKVSTCSAHWDSGVRLLSVTPETV